MKKKIIARGLEPRQ